MKFIAKYVGVGVCLGVGYVAATVATLPLTQRITTKIALKNMEKMFK